MANEKPQTGVKIIGMVVVRLGRLSAAIGLASAFLVAWLCSGAAEWVRAARTREMKKKLPTWADARDSQ